MCLAISSWRMRSEDIHEGVLESVEVDGGATAVLLAVSGSFTIGATA